MNLFTNGSMIPRVGMLAFFTLATMAGAARDSTAAAAPEISCFRGEARTGDVAPGGSIPGSAPRAFTYAAPRFEAAYRQDGRYTTSKLDLGPPQHVLRPPEVPRTIELSSSEETIQDYAPPRHAVRKVKSPSALGMIRDGIVSWVYGREQVLSAPTHLTSDSRQRVIVSDPALPAVHVLDPSGRRSFRIIGGTGYRLQQPAGVAVDGADNIYVADRGRGLILVYDPDGRFLHYIGVFKGESLFESPSGIAIDRARGHLYVADSSANLLFMLDLEGRVLRKAGGIRNNQVSGVLLQQPGDVAVAEDRLAVLDFGGSRALVFSLDFRLLRTITLVPADSAVPTTSTGIALDSRLNLYVSNLAGSTVRVYGANGTLIHTLGRQGFAAEEFNAPSGLWLDPAYRLYIADTKNSRVQIFVVSPEPDGPRGSTPAPSVGGR